MRRNKEPLLSSEDVARLRMKYPSSKMWHKKEQHEVILPVHKRWEPEYGPIPEAIAIGLVKVCSTCHIREAARYKPGRTIRCLTCEARRGRQRRVDYPKKDIIRRLKQNAGKRGIEFNLREHDIPDFPEYCSVFPWIKLEYRVGEGVGQRSENGAQNRTSGSVSIDRIDNEKGYIRGNIRVISNRANGLKGDASDRELIALGKDAEKRMATAIKKPTARKETNVN